MDIPTKADLDDEMRQWWDNEVSKKRSQPQQSSFSSKPSTSTVTLRGKAAEKAAKQLSVNGGTNSNTNENNANV